jgi:hypothetical protein
MRGVAAYSNTKTQENAVFIGFNSTGQQVEVPGAIINTLSIKKDNSNDMVKSSGSPSKPNTQIVKGQVNLQGKLVISQQPLTLITRVLGDQTSP